MDRTRETETDLFLRYLTMLLDGINAERGPLTDLPVNPFDEDDTQTAMRPHHADARAAGDP